ncbi:hypothetical protein F5887DRAFT_916839 [Amanita rubescens]|nr:hypothetical protein F5887DRAFT_916839 [Amanita rubescens]
MPLLLLQRGRCSQSSCLCKKTVFVDTEALYRQQPINANEVCLCGHKWWMHVPRSPPSTERGTCPSTQCGGFHSSTDIPHTGPCVCGALYDAHELLSAPFVPADSASASAAPSASTAIIARTPPAHAYTSAGSGVIQPWIPPPAVIANQQRQDAARRHRKPSRVQPPVPSVSNPPALSDSSSQYLQLNCAIWPFVVKKPMSSVYPVPETSFNRRDLGEVMQCLLEHHLVFSVIIARSEGHPWEPINNALYEQLDKHGYVLTRRQGDVGQQFTRLSWDILAEKKNKKGKNVKHTFQSGIAGPTSFTFDFLDEQGTPVELENPANEHPFILIAPREEHLKGPVSDGGVPCPDGPHACFPWRMFAPYDWGTKGTNVESSTTLNAPVNTNSLRRTRSPSPELPRNTRPRQGTVSEEPQEEDDLPDIDELPRLDVFDWQHRIRLSRAGIFALTAPTVEDASATLIDLLKWIIGGSAPYLYFPQDPNIYCNITSAAALLHYQPRPFYIQKPNGKHTSLGDGPAIAVYQGALDMRIGSERWTDINDGFYRTLSFSPAAAHVKKSSLVEFKIDGILTALVMVQLLAEPYPVNPFLVYAAFFSEREPLEFLMDPTSPDDEYKRDHLLAMIPDKETRRALAELFKLDKKKTVSALQASRHPLYRRAFEDPIGAGATFFNEARDDDQHENIRRQLFNVLLIGHDEPWKHPHFIAFSRGLRLGLLRVKHIVKPIDVLEYEDEEDIFLYAIQLVMTLWNNRITGPDDIMRHVQYRLINPFKSPEAMLFAELFHTRFSHWLRGQGHPHELVGNFISDEMYQKSLKTPKATRAKLLWKAVSDFDVLPAATGLWAITVKLTFDPYLPATESHVPLKISVCTKTIYVTLGQALINLLIEPGHLHDQKDTRFDVWIHKLLTHATKDYNRA